MNPTRNRSTIIYLLLFIAIISLVVINYQQRSPANDVLTINQVAADIQAGQVSKIQENDNDLTVTYSDGSQRKSHKENTSTLVQQLKELGATTEMLQSDKVKL